MAPATQYLLGLLIVLALGLHVSSYGGRRANTWLVAALRALESILLTIIVMFWTYDRVESDADRTAVGLGWPLNYVVQDQSRFDPPYPYDLGWAWEVPTHFNLWTMSFNCLFFIACTYCVHWVVSKLLFNGTVAG